METAYDPADSSITIKVESITKYNDEKSSIVKIETCNYVKAHDADTTLDNSFRDLNAGDDQLVSFKTEVNNTRGILNSETLDALDKSQLVSSDEEFYKCEKCSYQTTIASYLRRHHRRTHSIMKKEFKCDTCDKFFSFKSQLKEHQIVHSDLRPFKCTKCDFRAKSNFVFKKHQKVHKDISELEKFSCSKCDFVTKHRHSLQGHYLTHIDVSELKTTFACKMCNYVGKSKLCLKRHEVVHKNYSEIKTFKCEFCVFVTKRRGSIVAHVRKHNIPPGEIKSEGFSFGIHSPYNYQCHQCNFQSTCRSSLKKHLVSHSNGKPFQCDHCSYSAKTQCAIKTHQKVHKDMLDVKLYSCSKCNYVTKYSSSHKQHELTHLDLSEVEKTFPCDMCDYVGKRKQLLKEHKWIHSDVSDVGIVKCEFCDYETNYPKRLKGHKRRCHKPKTKKSNVAIMTPDDDSLHKPFKCSECSFATKFKSVLIKHQATHSEERPFQCYKCPFKAKTRDCMRNHQMVHTDSKLFPCDQCPYVAKIKLYLRMHQKVHKDLGKVKCDKCDFTTSRIEYVRKHYKRIHKDILPATYNFTNSMNDYVEDSDIQNASNNMMQPSSVCEDDHTSTMDIKFNDSDTLIESDVKIKIEDELNFSIKTESETAYNYQNSGTFVSVGINSIKVENNLTGSVLISDFKEEYVD